MSQVMKSFLAIFMAMFLVVLSIGILSSFFNIISAQNMHSLFISELENSHFNAGVISDCFDRANSADMKLEISFYGSDNSEIFITDKSEISDELKNASLAKVDLYFENRIVFLDFLGSHVLSGYAR